MSDTKILNLLLNNIDKVVKGLIMKLVIREYIFEQNKN